MKRMGILLGVVVMVSMQGVIQASEARGRRRDHRREREYRPALPFDSDLRNWLDRLYTSIVDKTHSYIFELQHDNERLRQERNALFQHLADKQEQLTRVQKALSVAKQRIKRKDKKITRLEHRGGEAPFYNHHQQESRYLEYKHQEQ